MTEYKEGYLEKASGTPTGEELAAINRLSRRKLSADEVFVFSVVLCDNEVDRDLERFTIDALQTLSKLFVGKTGIFDHSMRGRDQTARIFECGVEVMPERTTKAGEAYHRLKARAYMPRTSANGDLILEIDAGIKKEVSVGCATAMKTCSVCGADIRHGDCGHIKGRQYHKNGKKVLCHAVLGDPTDAYEWSFVAVPAQPQAGVVKGLKAAFKEENSMNTEEIIKGFDGKETVTLTAEQAAVLKSEIEALRTAASVGREYLEEMRKSAVRYCLIAQPEMDAETVGGMTERMNFAELKAFCAAYETAAAKAMPLRPQLAPRSGEKRAEADQNYLI